MIVNNNNTTFIPKLNQLPDILKHCANDLSTLIGEQIDKILKLMAEEKENSSEVLGVEISGMQKDAQEIYNFFANIWGSSEQKEQSAQELVKQLELLDKEIEPLESKYTELKQLFEAREYLAQKLGTEVLNRKQVDEIELFLENHDKKIVLLQSEIERLEQKVEQKEKLEEELLIARKPTFFANEKFKWNKIENLIKNNNTFTFDNEMKEVEKKISLIEGSLEEVGLNLKEVENDLQLINEKLNKETDPNKAQDLVFQKEKLEKQHLELKKYYLAKSIELKEAHGSYALVYARQIEAFVSKAKVLQQEFDRTIDIEEMEVLLKGVTQLYENIFSETQDLKKELESLDTKTWGEFFKELGEIFEDSKLLNELNEELAGLLTKIKEGDEKIDESELEIFNRLMENTSLLKGNLGEKFKGFALKHKNIMKILTTVPTVGLGFLMGGPLGAFAFKMLSDKCLKSYLPESESGSYLEKFGMGALETVLSLVAGPYAALSTALAKTVQETASEGVQNVVIATTVGLSTGGVTGIGLGFLAGLISAKPQMLTSLGEDIKHIWTNIKEKRILTIFKDILLFVPKQLFDNCVGIKRALTKVDGKRDIVQAITRVAIIALAAGIIAASYWTLPLAVAIFYLVNKAYQPRKYEGLASFGNQSFRKYVANEINEKRRTLEEVLLEEQIVAYNEYIHNANKLNYDKNN